MCIIDCLSTIVFILPLHLDYTKVIILILWWRNFQLEYWRTFQLVSTGKSMASTIFRKKWFEHEGVEDSNDGQQRIVGIHNEHAFRSLKQLETQQMLLMITCPDGPEGAEWKNYTNTPCTRKKMKAPDNTQWTKVPARMEDMFGNPYLTEKDWWI